MINIYIANLGAYNRGYLVGKWVTLPTYNLDDEIDEVLNGKDAIESRDFEDEEDEEVAIHDYETDVEGIIIGEYENIEDLNDLAMELDRLDAYDIEKLEAVLEWGYYKFEEALSRLDEFSLHTDIKDEYDLGYYFAHELGGLGTESTLAIYFDYEAYGRDIDLDGNGYFSKHGWIECI